MGRLCGFYRIPGNVFFVPQESEIRLNRSTRNTFDGNYYLGNIKGRPEDPNGRNASDYYNRCISKDPSGFNSLSFLFDTVVIGDGSAILKAVNRDTIHRFLNDERRMSLSKE